MQRRLAARRRCFLCRPRERNVAALGRSVRYARFRTRALDAAALGRSVRYARVRTRALEAAAFGRSEVHAAECVRSVGDTADSRTLRAEKKKRGA